MDEQTKKAEEAELLGEFTLSAPIKAYGEEVKVLKLRQITAADLLQVGNPVIFTPHADPPRVDFDYPKLLRLVARLSQVPSSSLEKIEPQDMVELGWVIAPFLIPARRTT